METTPSVLVRPMSSVEFPFIWSNEDKQEVYRKAGGVVQVLDSTDYVDLYTKAGFVEVVPALVTIAVTGANTVAVGASTALTATGTYDDESSADLTSTVIWASSDDTKATVDAAGNVTGVAEGAVTITATEGAVVSNAFSVTITAV